ncbi:AAA ATPase [Rhodotorula kratochvilovae]
MLGKRTRTSDSALAPSKRPLAHYIVSSKPTTSPITAKTSPPLERSLSQKENQRVVACVQDAQDDVFSTGMGEELDVGEYILPTPPLAEDLEIVAPTAPVEAHPVRGIPNIYTHASSLLSPSLSTAALSLLGRADQRETLLAFLTRRFPSIYAAQGKAGPSTPTRGPGPAAMYVSGPPGIGKTALIGAIVQQLRERVHERDLKGEVCVAMENCAAIAAGGVSGDKAWERLGAALGVDIDGDAAMKAKERFEQGLKDGRKYLLVLDEIDHLVSPSLSSSRLPSSQQPDLLNALFALASIPASPLTLIGIANDLTLTALSLSPTPSPVKGKGKAKADPLLTPVKPIRLHFKPYAWQELVAIVDQRLSLLAPSYPDLAPPSSNLAPPADAPPAKKTYPLIDKPALERCAKKIATGTGDVRTMLDVARLAIAAVAHEQASACADLASFTPATAPKAGMKHVSVAFAASAGLTSAPSLAARLAALQGGPHQRFVLVSTMIALSRLDLPSSTSGICAGLDRPSSAYEAARVTADVAYKVYRELVAREDVLRPSALDQAAYVETLGMVEDLGGFVVVRGRPGSSPSSSPSKKGGVRTTPTKLKRGEKGRLTVELASTAPMADLVAALVQPPPVGKENDEDEVVRLARRALERERSDQQWRVKRLQLGRDEERRAEEELEGLDWERRLLAREQEGGSA